MPTVDLTRIGSNIGALYSLQSLLTINNKLATHQTRLSTGKRLNSAMDDPAGLTIATKMNARSEGLKVTMDNISDAKNMLSVAEGGLSKITSILVTMRAKANQAASDTLGSAERTTIQTQLSAFAAQIDDILAETKWNGVKLLDGTASRTFQTGVDEGETTNWQLAQSHVAGTAGLNVSKAYTSEGIDSFTRLGDGFTAETTSGSALNNLTKVGTGTYEIEVLDKAASNAVGKFNLSSGSYGGGVSAATASTTGADELSSGTWRFEVVGGAGLDDWTDVSYKLTKVGTSTTITVNNADLTIASVAGALVSATGVGDAARLGVTLTRSGTLSVGQNFDFEYIKSNSLKYELNDGVGTALTIDDGDGGDTTTTGLVGYKDVTTTQSIDTGRGLVFTANATLANIDVGDTDSVEYHIAGTHVVDVSTAIKAGSYMTKVDNAMDVVNNTLADLGSLMARMTIKEEAASTAQINVEASYNRIMNANMAEEQVNASKFLVLQQTAVAMLAQANQAPQFLLSLFR